MMGGGIEFIMVILLMLGQSGQDMLDFVTSDAYWAQKNVTVTVEQLRQDAGPDAKVEKIDKELKALESPEFAIRDAARKKIMAMGPAVIDQLTPLLEAKDEEVAGTAKGMIEELTKNGQARPVRRLMAIRTLGEKKDKDSLPLLNQLATSKEPFVADYANRAIAEIEGKPWKRTFDEKALAADLALLPKDAGIVGQARAVGEGKPLTLSGLLKEMVDGLPENQQEQANKQLAAITVKMNKAIIDAADRAGNVRLDGMTMGVSEDIGSHKGWVAISLRGQMSSSSLIAAITSLDESMKDKGEQIEGFKAIRLEDSVAVLLPSDQQLIFVAGPNAENADSALKAVATAIKTGKPADGGIAANEKLQALLKGLDTKSGIWAAGTLSEELKQEETFAAFDAFKLITKTEKGTINYTVTATGPDADKIKESVTKLNEEFTKSLAQMPEMGISKAAVEMMKSIKIESDGKTAKLTGKITKDGLMGTMAPMMGMFMMMGGMEDALPGAVEGVGEMNK